MCSTACLLANRTVAAGAELLFELALFRFATRPGARQAPGDACGLHDVQQARTPARGMERETRLEVAGAAQVVARVLVAGVKMEQVDHRYSFGRPAEQGRLPDVRMIYSPLQYALECRRCEYQEPRSLLRRCIWHWWMGHQLGSVSLVRSDAGGGGGVCLPSAAGAAPLVLAAVWVGIAAWTAASRCSCRMRSVGAGGGVGVGCSAVCFAACWRAS